MRIRESTESDKAAIFRVHLEAFGEEEGESVSQLAINLLEDKTALPLVSLVAEKDNTVVGHVIYSAVVVKGSTHRNGYILAPLAVLDSHQGSGIGTVLINEGLNILRERNAEFVLVYGNPDYYSRTGFKAGHGIRPPYNLTYPQAWMAQELKEGALKDIRGKVQCAASLHSPEYW